MPARLRACLLALPLLLQPPLVVPVGLVLAGGVTSEAAAQARSSGGYSRPRSGGYARTPSFGGTRVAPRTPSSRSYGGSGGYSLPSAGSRRPSILPPGTSSGWDRGYSQERSSEALNRMRRQQQEATRPQQLPPAAQPGAQPGTRPGSQPDPGWWRRGGTRGGGYGGGYAGNPVPRNGGWFRDRGFSPGGLGGLAQGNFGLWSGVFLGYLLSNLGRAGATDFFHNHQDDPGYRDWRAQAEQQAQADPEIRRQLDELDRRLAERRDQPRDPNYLPPDVPPEVAMAPRDDVRTPTTAAPADEAGTPSLLWLLILGGGGAFALLAFRRSRAGATATPATGGRDIRPTTPRPGADFSAAPRFRLGMTLTCDPTPFLLGGAALKVPPPSFTQGSPQVSVQAIGRIREGTEELTRLYLPNGQGYFQIHLDAQGQMDECRYFAVIDEVTPADANEWSAWLDPQQGMIGWPEFQTKDGKTYARAWAPGDNPVPPRDMTERIETLDGTKELRLQAMLYAAPTGAAPPAPQAEYILVSALEVADRAGVEIRAGIDINPASLSLT